jgi:hypothetical protein
MCSGVMLRAAVNGNAINKRLQHAGGVGDCQPNHMCRTDSEGELEKHDARLAGRHTVYLSQMSRRCSPGRLGGVER